MGSTASGCTVNAGAAHYGASLMQLLGDPALLGRLRQRCLADAAGYSLPEMVDRFVGGVLAWSGRA